MEWMSLGTSELIEKAMMIDNGLDGYVDELTRAKMVEVLRNFFSLMTRLLSYQKYSQSRWIRDE